MNKIKTMALLLFMFASQAYAQNEVYMDQVGDSSTITITQTGQDNKIGTTLTPVFIGGGSNTVTIDQIGDTNKLEFIVNGAATNMAISVVGNNNNQTITCGTLVNASCSGSTINQTILGDSNNTTVNLGAGANHTSIMNITGDSNHVTHTSTSTGTTSANITISGNSNTIGVTQSGTLTNSVVLSSTGNNSTVNITQSN
jgi:hypothetical protein